MCILVKHQTVYTFHIDFKVSEVFTINKLAFFFKNSNIACAGAQIMAWF